MYYVIIRKERGCRQGFLGFQHNTAWPGKPSRRRDKYYKHVLLVVQSQIRISALRCSEPRSNGYLFFRELREQVGVNPNPSSGAYLVG